MISPFRPKARLAADSDRVHEFRKIVLVHLDGAYSLARYLSGDPVQSEDIVQDAVLRAFRHFHGYAGGDARAWLLAIVRNCCLTWQRRSRPDRNTIPLTADTAEASGPGSDQLAIDSSERAVVERALAELPPEFREVVVLREVEDLSYKEISDVIGVPIGTVMSRLARARKRLAALLGAGAREAS